MNERGRSALSAGRVWTPAGAEVCGVHLKVGKRYLLAGNVRSGRAVVNLCNWHHDWTRLTAAQRKGLRKLYQRACDCKVLI